MYFIILTLLDQLIKFWVVKVNLNFKIINNFFNLIFTKNTGGIYGVLQNNNILFILISAVIIICLILYGYKNLKNDKTKFILWQFILAGGVSNIIDRIFRGYVVDYIQLKLFGVFNLADAYIVISVIIIILLELKESISENRRNKSN